MLLIDPYLFLNNSMTDQILTSSPWFDKYISRCHIQYTFIYLQPPRTILAQVQLHRKIPIHTVSFNCEDMEANKFLYELSTETEGRFHYYNIYLTDPDAAEFIVVSI